jgi:hypothetical protein
LTSGTTIQFFSETFNNDEFSNIRNYFPERSETAGLSNEWFFREDYFKLFLSLLRIPIISIDVHFVIILLDLQFVLLVNYFFQILALYLL